jgi:Uncharacterized archaeal kinase related to aspartokinases, uridylate kinases
MWVVKVGGSLANADVLKLWLHLLAYHGSGRVVIVPGGGPFANQVRDAQARWGFQDAIAHRMAILAMEQFGLMMAGIQPELSPADTVEGICAVIHRGGVSVWLPAVMTEEREELVASWDLTSDSLAAWLAVQLNARRLILVKSAPLPLPTVHVQELYRQGMVDALFPDFASRGNFETWCINHAQYETMTQALMDKVNPGTHVLWPELTIRAVY